MLMYGHKSTECKDERKCSYCAGPHDRSKCTKEEKKCVNCSIINLKYNPQHSYDHDSNSEKDCPVLAKRCKLARETIDNNNAFVL